MLGSVLVKRRDGLGKFLLKGLHGMGKDVEITSKDKELKNKRQEVQSGEEMVNKEGVCLNTQWASVWEARCAGACQSSHHSWEAEVGSKFEPSLGNSANKE